MNIDLRKRFATGITPENMTQFLSELEEILNGMISQKHAPVKIPNVTIDASTGTFSATATGWGTNNLATTGTTASASFATILSYTGRGVLRMLVAGEVSGSLTNACVGGIRLTVDGNVIYSNSAINSTQSQLLVVVGGLNWTSKDQFALLDDPIGIPFNQSLLIEGLMSSPRSLNVGWRLSKKL